VDPDDSMLRAAEANVAVASDRITKGGGELRLLKGGFGEIGALGLRRADALTCTGNALPHVVGVDGLRDALADFAAVLRPGGVLVLHLLNHTRLIEKKPRSIMPVVREVPEGTRVFLRVIDYPVGDGEFFGFDFVTLVRTMAGEWTCASHKAAHTQLPVAVLRFELESAGFERIESFGGHDRRRLDEDSDESVILVARLAP
jgi:SAM-dependent methyltransferase